MTNGKRSTEWSSVERLFAEFIRSNIGLAVIDRQLRYRAVNAFLAPQTAPRPNLIWENIYGKFSEG